MTSFNDITDPSASKVKSQLGNFIKNIFPEVKNFVRYLNPYPQVVNIVPDFFIVVHKLKFDYKAIVDAIREINTIGIDALTDQVFQINDVRDFKSNMNVGKAIGSASFTLNDRIINNNIISPVPVNWDNPDIIIDKMDIVKIFERNRFDDNYTDIFTGLITVIQPNDQPKVDYSFVYTAADITAALKLSQTITTPSFAQLLKNGFIDPKLKKNIQYQDSLVVNKDAYSFIKSLIANAWYIYPSTSQIETQNQLPTNKTLTKIEVENPSKLGLLNIITFPANSTKIRAYGNVIQNFNNFSFYQSVQKTLYDIVKDIADITGFEFYATPEGNIYYGIPKWDLDIDGAYYRINKDNTIERVGYYDSNGNLHDDPQDLVDDADIYTINSEDYLGFQSMECIDNIFTRVDIIPTDFSQDILNAKSSIGSALQENVNYSYPNFKFDDASTFDENDEKFKDLVRYGLKVFPVNSKPFLNSQQAILGYAQFTYDKLKATRRTGTMNILPRPEMVQGRTVRIPHLNMIAYIAGISHSIQSKKNAMTTLNLIAIRSADIKNDIVSPLYQHSKPFNPTEDKYGFFVPIGTFDYTALTGS